MRVRSHGERWVGMAELPSQLNRCHAIRDRHAGVSVPQLMRSEHSDLRLPAPRAQGTTNVRTVKHLPRPAWEHQASISQATLDQSPPVSRQHFYRVIRKWQQSVACVTLRAADAAAPAAADTGFGDAEEPVLQVIPSEGGQLTGSSAGCERQVKHCMVLTRCPLARHPVARQLSDDLSGRADELEYFAAGPHGGFLPLVRVPLDVRCWVPA